MEWWPVMSDEQNSNRSAQDEDSQSKNEDGARAQNIIFNQPVDHRGTQLYVKCWLVPESAKPPIVIVHDVGDSLGSYRELTKGLVDRGFSTIVFDLRGHGRSGRVLGHIENFQDLCSDLLQVVAWVKFKCDRKVPIIFSHGISAGIVLSFMKRNPRFCRGAILVEPNLSPGVGKWKRVLVRVLSEIAPRFKIPKSLALGMTDSNERSLSDVSSKFADEVLTSLQSLDFRSDEILCPCFLVRDKSGESDPIFFESERVKNVLVEIGNIYSLLDDRVGELLDHIEAWVPSMMEIPLGGSETEASRDFFDSESL